eukprot:TRINITY_DN9388_c0_g1_i1.p1 TRINITY_DN9388_c0_g1~~TRINITY_DN9388_c0_g1_i1.p1  ORF type:complete len:473 (-),score=138.76 TRINITY_DN9388_c0_g1_i1:81-1445(-)
MSGEVVAPPAPAPAPDDGGRGEKRSLAGGDEGSAAHLEELRKRMRASVANLTDTLLGGKDGVQQTSSTAQALLSGANCGGCAGAGWGSGGCCGGCCGGCYGGGCGGCGGCCGGGYGCCGGCGGCGGCCGATAPGCFGGCCGVVGGNVPAGLAGGLQQRKPVVKDKGDLPAGIAAMFKNGGSRPAAQQSAKPVPAATLESLRRAAEEANARRNGGAGASAAAAMTSPSLGAVSLATVGAPSATLQPGLMHAEIQAELAVQQQLLQRHRFQIEMRNYEATRGDVVYYGRFKEGQRPIQMCRSMQQFGMCQRGESCTFAHAMEELHPASADLQKVDPVVSSATGGVGVPALAEQAAVPDFLNAMPQMQMKKKREICQRMSGNGCLLGERCKFAHSEEELGKVCLVIVDDRVKRTMCRFWESGRRCSYGAYCVNAHGMEEIGRLKPPESLCPSGPRHS